MKQFVQNVIKRNSSDDPGKSPWMKSPVAVRNIFQKEEAIKKTQKQSNIKSNYGLNDMKSLMNGIVNNE